MLQQKLLLSQIKSFFLFRGNLENPYSVGTNNLIKNGAYLTTSYKDILEKFPEFSKKKKRIKRNIVVIKKEYKEIYMYLTNEFQSVDKIAQKSGKSVREVINILTLMEIDGLISFDFGKGYKKKEV